MKLKQIFSRDMIILVLGQVISLFGNAIVRFALPLYLLRETNSPSLFGVVTACSFLPMVVFSFLGGGIAGPGEQTKHYGGFGLCHIPAYGGACPGLRGPAAGPAAHWGADAALRYFRGLPAFCPGQLAAVGAGGGTGSGQCVGQYGQHPGWPLGAGGWWRLIWRVWRVSHCPCECPVFFRLRCHGVFPSDSPQRPSPDGQSAPDREGGFGRELAFYGAGKTEFPTGYSSFGAV